VASKSHGPGNYFLRWEMFPFNAEQDTVRINAGDAIHGSVAFDTVNNVFDIVVTDLTLHKGLSEAVPCQPDMGGCPRSSAEVISEDTGGANNVDGVFSLPNYGTESFTNVSVADVNGHTGTLTNPNWTTNDVTQVSSEGVTKQTVGPLSPDGSSFAAAWRQYTADGVTVQVGYRALSTVTRTPELDIELDVVNTGTNPVDLDQLAPEYWFSADGASPLQFACDFALLGCANITANFRAGIGTPPAPPCGPIRSSIRWSSVKARRTGAFPRHQTSDIEYCPACGCGRRKRPATAAGWAMLVSRWRGAAACRGDRCGGAAHRALCRAEARRRQQHWLPWAVQMERARQESRVSARPGAAMSASANLPAV
jgi:hypothetical protein